METALFSPSALFGDGDGDGDGVNSAAVEGNEENETLTTPQLYVERTHSFPGIELTIREFSFHHLNANLLWPGSFSFGECGTGALAIFLRRSFGVDITTSDFDDKEVEENIAYNCRINGLAVLPHIRHSWGDVFPTTEPDWDLIIASDILLYVKQYPKLIKTLCILLNSYKPKDEKAVDGILQRNKTVTISGKQIQLRRPFFLMSWRRRIGRDEEIFFSGCENAGLIAEHIGSRVYYISPKRLQ